MGEREYNRWKIAEYRRNNRDRDNAVRRAWYAANADRINAAKRAKRAQA